MVSGVTIRRWSTSQVEPEMRVDYWMSAIGESLWPVTHWSGLNRDFGVDLQDAPLGPLLLAAETISPHASRRTRLDVERSEAHCYQLFVNKNSPWSYAQNDSHGRVRRGDVVLFDSRTEFETHVPHGFDGIIVQCPASWILTWLPDPRSLVGRVIARESQWGRVISPMLRQFHPGIAAAPPLPASVLVDQVGAMLALAANSLEPGKKFDSKKVRECIRERCVEPSLTAADIANTLDIPVARVHQSLRSEGHTFAAALMTERIAMAASLLGSSQLSIGEIALRTGFSSESQLARVLSRSGIEPRLAWQRKH
jgi:AraC family transcriptional activator of tynA and feaB